jgi:hypothetical protein
MVANCCSGTCSRASREMEAGRFLVVRFLRPSDLRCHLDPWPTSSVDGRPSSPRSRRLDRREPRLGGGTLRAADTCHSGSQLRFLQQTRRQAPPSLVRQSGGVGKRRRPRAGRHDHRGAASGAWRYAKHGRAMARLHDNVAAQFPDNPSAEGRAILIQQALVLLSQP